MAAVADGIAVGAAATAHQHGGGLVQPQITGDQTGAQVSSIAEPAMTAATAAAEQVATGRQFERLGAMAGCCGLRHDGSALPLAPEPSLLRFSGTFNDAPRPPMEIETRWGKAGRAAAGLAGGAGAGFKVPG